MHRSLNFLVEFDNPLEDSRPAGLEFTEGVKAILTSGGRITQAVHNWRDVGWEFRFETADEEYSVIVSRLAEPTRVLLQLSPTRWPNVLSRLFGKQASATDAGLERRRLEIHRILSDTPHVVDVTFAYDRFP